ncbi:CoxG family protein [Streptomyces sp. NPDC050560]|uniref:CoxG family protein n=1 Tax=Streptomyces sp. NPDC050560 TaxID=3365630 RepID=UPI0037B75FC3
MALETFSRSLTVAAARPRAWEVLTDVETLAGWVGIVHDVTELSRLEKYRAVLQDRVGPFRLTARLAVSVAVEEEGRRIAVTASGRDRAVDSRISVDAVLELADSGTGTALDVRGKYQVTGKVAAMGGGIVRKKADRILEDFFSSAEKALG